MIEKKFIKTKLRAFRINEFIKANTTGSGFSHSLVQRTPLGEKIIIYASRPRLVVGSSGQNIKRLTINLKNKFKYTITSKYIINIISCWLIFSFI